MESFKVKSTTNPGKLAGAIAGSLKEEQCVELQTIGTKALKRAVMAVAIARKFVESEGVELMSTPVVEKLKINDKRRTMITLEVKKSTY